MILTQNGEVGRKGLDEETIFAMDFKEQARFPLEGKNDQESHPQAKQWPGGGWRETCLLGNT